MVGSSVVLAAGAAAFAVSLVPPVHRARVELSVGSGRLPIWSDAAVQDIVRRMPLVPPVADIASAEPQTGAASDLSTPALLTEGSASRRAGLLAVSPRRAVVWAEASDAGLASLRAHFISGELLAGSDRAARRSVPTATSEPEASREDTERHEAAERRAAEARARLSDFEAEAAAAERDAATRTEPLRRRIETLEAQAALWADAQATVEGNAADAALPPALDGADAWRRDVREAEALRLRSAELARTLASDNPRARIVRLRLEQLDAQLAQSRGALLARIGLRREANARDLDAARAELAQSAAAAERGDARAAERDRLAAALAGAEAELSAITPDQAPPAAPGPQADEGGSGGSIEQRTLEPSVRSLSVWPAALAGGVFGFLGSAFFLTLLRPLRAPRVASPVPVDAEPLAVARPEMMLAIQGEYEVARVDDVIDALKRSGVSRALVVAATGADARPLGVDIARRLALRGRSVALVDLSMCQAAARAMGVPGNGAGFTDFLKGDAALSGIMRRDFATSADVAGSGTYAEGAEMSFAGSDSRRGLDFVERSYETLIIDCGTLEPDLLRAIYDPDAALLMAVEGCDKREIERAASLLETAGLKDMILVRD